MTKKIFGYIFLGIAGILATTFLPQFPKVLALIVTLFIGSSESYNLGYNIGMLTYYVVHAGLAVLLGWYGLKWTQIKL